MNFHDWRVGPAHSQGQLVQLPQIPDWQGYLAPYPYFHFLNMKKEKGMGWKQKRGECWVRVSPSLQFFLPHFYSIFFFLLQMQGGRVEGQLAHQQVKRVGFGMAPQALAVLQMAL